jgi:heme-degrading monooxygenase HmoA
MYTVVERRKVNAERMQETVQRAQGEFFPKLQQAPGFIGFYLVNDEGNAINTAILVWESKAQFDDFDAKIGKGWTQTLEELGHTLQSDNRGETVIEITPKQ